MDRSREVKKKFEILLNDSVKTIRRDDKIIKGWKGYKLKVMDEEEEEIEKDDEDL